MLKKTFTTTIFSLLALLFFIGCTPAVSTDSDGEQSNANSESSAESESAMPQELEGTSWKLRAFSLVDEWIEPMAGTELTVMFAEGQASGGAGCNSYFGSYTAENGSIDLGPLGATRMMCEENVMNQESSFLANLAEAQSYLIDENGLTIQLGGGAELVFDAVTVRQ